MCKSNGYRLILKREKLIKKQLTEGIEEIREGRVHGPFQSVQALLRSIHRSKKTGGH